MGVWNHATVHVHPKACTAATLRMEVTKGLFTYRIAGISGRQLTDSELTFCSAIRHAGFPSPKSQLHKISITLDAHSEEKCDFSLYETAAVVGYLCLSRHIPSLDPRICILGSLNLGGEATYSNTIYAAVRTAISHGIRTIYIPESAAAYVSGFLSKTHFTRPDQYIYSYASISDLLSALKNSDNKKNSVRPSIQHHFDQATATYLSRDISTNFLNNPLSAANKRAIILACIGHHPLVLWGPPGQGKTAAFQFLDQLIPPSDTQVRAGIECAASKWGIANASYVRPSVTIHHSITLQNFLSDKKYSVIEQARGHVLVMDEFVDFKIDVLLSLRTLFDAPLTGEPSTLIIAGFNPCPCGKYGTDQACTCSAAARHRYAHKVPDSVWDRFHIYSKTQLDTSEKSRQKGESLLALQPLQDIYACATARKKALSLSSWQNGRLVGQEIAALIKTFERNASDLIENQTESFLSVRKRLQAITVARTIADVSASDSVTSEHVLEALSLITALPFAQHKR